MKDLFAQLPSVRGLLAQLPSLPYPLKALLILTSGVILLRIAGKRALSEMTVAEAVMRIAIGTILIQPLAMKKEWEALYGGTLLVIGIVLSMKVMQWFPKAREFIVGIPSVLIKDGKIMFEELKKARLTTDELEIALRQSKIGSIADVELCLLESSGKYSVTLKPNKAPATKEDIQKILDILAQNGITSSSKNQSGGKTASLFKEAYHEAKNENFKPEKH